MNTGHFDAEGNEISEGDVVERVYQGGLRGVVVRAEGRHLIACGQSAQMFTYHIDDSKNWRVIGNIATSPELAKARA